MSLCNARLRGAWKCLMLAAGVVVAGCGSGPSSEGGATPAHAGLPAPAPDPDPFYDAPEAIAQRPGTVLKSRPITYQPAGVVQPNAAWQLQYVTRSASGRSVAAVATVVSPAITGSYGKPVLLSFQHAYDSLGAGCTPSHTATGSTANTTNMAETLEYLPPLQSLGWTVVIPDYEGPDHAFGAGPLSGRATLDAIRAALSFEPLGLDADSPVGLWGYSGGAYATTWAAALQPDYAPELHLVGAVSGGTPVDLFDIIRRNEDTGSFDFLFTLVLGAAREYPQLLPASRLTAKGLEFAAAMKDTCEGAAPEGLAFDGRRMTDYVAADDPYLTPGFQSVAPELSLLASGIVPTADIYLYHEIDDELVPIDGADALAERWCADGVPLNYYRANSGTVTASAPTGVHTSGAALGTPAAIAYLDSRFRGLPLAVTPPGTQRCNG